MQAWYIDSGQKTCKIAVASDWVVSFLGIYSIYRLNKFGTLRV